MKLRSLHNALRFFQARGMNSRVGICGWSPRRIHEGLDLRVVPPDEERSPEARVNHPSDGKGNSFCAGMCGKRHWKELAFFGYFFGDAKK